MEKETSVRQAEQRLVTSRRSQLKLAEQSERDDLVADPTTEVTLSSAKWRPPITDGCSSSDYYSSGNEM